MHLDTGRKFHELTQGYELLLDPLRRMALDAKQRLKEAQQRRYASANDKRKHMLDELEQREREFKKARVEQKKKQQEIYRENETLMEQGRQLREQKEKEMRQREEEARKAAEPQEDEPPSLGMCDLIRPSHPFRASPNPSQHRPPRYNRPAQILSHGPPSPDHLRIARYPPATVWRDRRGFDCAFDQGEDLEKEKIILGRSETWNSACTIQTDRRCVCGCMREWGEGTWAGGGPDLLGGQ